MRGGTLLLITVSSWKSTVWSFHTPRQSHGAILRCRMAGSDRDSKSTITQPVIRQSESRSVVMDNPVDSFFQAVTSDVGSIAFGIMGLLVLVVGRVVLDDTGAIAEDLAVQTRSNLLAVLSIGAVLLNGLTKLDVESVVADPVFLQGNVLDEPSILTPSSFSTNCAWCLESLLQATPTETVVILEKRNELWEIDALAGTIREGLLDERTSTEAVQLPPDVDAPILNRQVSKKDDSEAYLPTLQALPGRTEFFSYLPGNTQAVLVLSGPRNDQLIVLGSNQARTFTPRDISWCKTVVTRL